MFVNVPTWSDTVVQVQLIEPSANAVVCWIRLNDNSAVSACALLPSRGTNLCFQRDNYLSQHYLPLG